MRPFRDFWSDLLEPLFYVVIALVLVGGLVGLVFIANSQTNYTGAGNEFEITATITEVTDQSVLVNDITVVEGNGEAATWFNDKGGWLGPSHWELHDNYTKGWTQHKVGHVYQQGSEIPLKSLSVGQTISATGKIRSTRHGKSSQRRAIFDVITLS